MFLFNFNLKKDLSPCFGDLQDLVELESEMFEHIMLNESGAHFHYVFFVSGHCYFDSGFMQQSYICLTHNV